MNEDGAFQAVPFSVALRRLRLSAGLTQEELASQAGLSVRGISDLERGVRTKPRRETVGRLGKSLGLDSAHQHALYSAARAQRSRSAPRSIAFGTNDGVPVSFTSFVGREPEVARLSTLIHRADVRLLTLTGPGGVGKTRLAVRLAESSRQYFANGLVFVPLAAMHDPDLAMAAILRALRLKDDSLRSPSAGISRILWDRDLLLILDNLEHLLALGPELSNLLADCPYLTILVTSRSVLHISGEHVHPVQPLSVPRCEPLLSMEEMAHIDAIHLFLDRAQAASNFVLGPENAADIAAICRQLDGLPLAIELAASQLRTIPPRSLLHLIEHRLSVLVNGPRDGPVRLRTMRNAITWSYDLLPSDEQRLFRRLSVFVGGMTVESARAVLDVPDESDSALLLGIASLVDRSLCTRQDQQDDLPRFQMLETIREFGLEQLAASGELLELQRQHATYFLSLATQLRPDIDGPRGNEVLTTLDVEHPNLRAALTWSCDMGETQLGLQLSCALWKFWQVHAHLREGLSWLTRTLAASRGTRSIWRWQSLYAAGSFARQLGEYDRATEFSEELLVQAQAAEDAFYTGLALLTLGLIAYDQGAQHDARSRLEAALSLFSQPDHQHAEAMVRSFLADIQSIQGDDSVAMDSVNRAMAIWQARGDDWGIAIALGHKANAYRSRGDHDQAAACYLESLRLRAQMADPIMTADCLDEWSFMAVKANQLEWAARLFGAGESLRERLGTPRSLAHENTAQQAMDTMRNRLGENGFTIAFATGYASTLDQIMTEATDVVADRARRSEAGEPNAAARRVGLTRREVDVLRQLAEGGSDQEIAYALCVSRRTVTSHVTSILTKLQVSSRTAAATRAVRAELI